MARKTTRFCPSDLNLHLFMEIPEVIQGIRTAFQNEKIHRIKSHHADAGFKLTSRDWEIVHSDGPTIAQRWRALRPAMRHCQTLSYKTKPQSSSSRQRAYVNWRRRRPPTLYRRYKKASFDKGSLAREGANPSQVGDYWNSGNRPASRNLRVGWTQTPRIARSIHAWQWFTARFQGYPAGWRSWREKACPVRRQPHYWLAPHSSGYLSPQELL